MPIRFLENAIKRHMPQQIWENLISINSQEDIYSDHIGQVSNYVNLDDMTVDWGRGALPLEKVIALDTYPLPNTKDREGYYGDNHFNYWASGLRDYSQINDWCMANNHNISSYLDVGCASGRILRHFHCQGHGARLYGCDINRKHVDWICCNLPKEITVFQNTSIPHLPLPDECLDFISAFSVFTHIECFDTTWLMELRRILRPGGVAWLTIHSERIWRDIQPDWPLYFALNKHPEYQLVRDAVSLPKERIIFRWHTNRSYSANVFYSSKYIRNHWGRILNFVDIFPAKPNFQDIVVLKK